MTMLDIPPHVYERLQIEALRRGIAIERLAHDVLDAHLPPLPPTPHLREVLAAAGLLAALAPDLIARASHETATLEMVRADLDRSVGPPLSEVVMALRGPHQ